MPPHATERGRPTPGWRLYPRPDAGRVDYDAFARSPRFDRYLDALAAPDVASLSRDEQLALKFHPPGSERDLLLSGTFRIRYHDYDWALNSQ